MAEAAQAILSTATPNRSFNGHENIVSAVAVFPDGRRMVMSSHDQTLRLWDLKDGVVLKKMEGHCSSVQAVGISRDGQLIASGDADGKLIPWYGDSGKFLTQAIKGHSSSIHSLDFSPDGAFVATGSKDKTTKLWNTETWQVHGNPINCDGAVYCIRFSPSGELAIATDRRIEIWKPRNSECIAKFKTAIVSLAWTPDGIHLLSGDSTASTLDPTIREWDASTWQQVGDPLNGHSEAIYAIAVNSTGTLVASASYDNNVRLWRRSDRRTIAIYMHSRPVLCVAFSMDDKHIFSGGFDNKISEWAVPEDALLRDAPKEQAQEDTSPENAPEEQLTAEILPIRTTVCSDIIWHLPTIEELEMNVNGNNHSDYAKHSLLMARKGNWDDALHDALKSISIQHSLSGYLSQGIALCGKKLISDGMKAFDIAFMFTAQDPKNTHLLLLVKAIALFNANEHQEAMSRIQELAAACPDEDVLACRVVEAYLHVQLGIISLGDAHNIESADHFTAAIKSSAFSSEHAIHLKYEVFMVLFGWDLKSLWLTANQKRCHALLQAGKLAEAHEAYRYMMDMSDDETTVDCSDWSIAFEQQCRALYTSKGDAALSSEDYDKAIEFYSTVIDLHSASDIIFASRCTAKLGKMLWEDALLDAQQVIELNPSSYHGYELKNAALHGAEKYDEAIEAFEVMLSKLTDTTDMQIRMLRQQYISRSEAHVIIQKVIDTEMENSPPRLVDIVSGRLCDRDTQINVFKTSVEYRKLLSVTMKNFRMEHIKDVVATFYKYVMLSHRWQGKEPLLHDIQDRSVYELGPVDGTAKLQSFCKVVRDAGYRWAWSDTCCINKNNNVELQQSVNSMFVWYRHSALTVVYLFDVLPSSKSGALAMSVWNSRGWTVQEFLASKVVLFYQKDWTLYLDDHSSNHKESAAIMRELEDATGINGQALIAFEPGMSGAREKLQWSSMRVTTLQEDIAYSLFGIFGVHLSPIYGENRQNALGRLLQEIISQSSDITCLDWVGKSSDFNSCLPASITSYRASPSAQSSPLSEDEMQTLVTSLQDSVDPELASSLYQIFASPSSSIPQFMARRLRLPCIVFAVTAVRRRRGEDQQSASTFGVKAEGLNDLLITTEDRLIHLLRARPSRQSFLLVRPWDRSLLEPPDLAYPPYISDTDEDDWSPPVSPLPDSPVGPHGQNGPADPVSYSRALRLIARLGQPFSAFLLAQQQGGEYKRIASDRNIITQVKDMTAVRDMMDFRTLEIL